jgi:hypothetical protein
MLSLYTSHYLIPPPDYFWRWDPDDHTAAWSDGATLGFARELLPLLRELAREIGLPPLGSVLLVLFVAKHPDQLEEKWLLLDRYARTLGINDQAPATVQRLLEPVSLGCKLIAQLPEELRQSQGARLQLLRTLFAPAPNRLSIEKSIEIVREFRAAHAQQLTGEHDLRGMTRLLRDLKALVAAFESRTPESLEFALRTGVKQTSLDEAQLELPLQIQTTGDLWSDLEQSQDEEMQAVASLARQFLAVIQIPRPLHRADDQPVGGVSDIANKGNPARLLLSELANDDETLAIRLAYDEALYLRRETPPATPLPQRHVLLDNGILLWGRARLFATGVALALLKPRTPGEVVTLHGHVLDEFSPLEMATSQDLREWWSRLEIATDCGPALHAILDTLLADQPESQPEIILVTHSDVESALAPSLLAREWPTGSRFFLVTVTGSGRCFVSQRTEAGRREISRFALDLSKALQAS